MVALWHDLLLDSETRAVFEPCSLGKQWSRDYPIDVPATANRC